MSFPQDITLDEALELLAATIPTHIEAEEVHLDDALGRILAEDVIAPLNVPQSDTAAVDGYAFYHQDLANAPLAVVGSIKAGHPFQGEVKSGVAYRIFTGAPMPKDPKGNGPDTIAMQEHCTIDETGHVTPPLDLKQGTNYRPLGENIAKGDIALARGTRLGAAEIGLLAAIGKAKINVARRLRVALISMGDEVAETGSPAGFKDGMIHDSNRPMLKQLLQQDGHDVIDMGIIADHATALTAAFKDAANKADVIISSGGSSEGDEDHAREAIENNQGVVDIWRLALKPGRPMLAGRIHDVPIYAVPGNPVAAFVCYRLLAAPLMGLRQGQPLAPLLKIPAPADFSQRHRKGRAEYLRARITDQGIVLNGRPGAGVLTSLTGAHGLVEIPADHDDVKKGDILHFIPFREAGL